MYVLLGALVLGMICRQQAQLQPTCVRYKSINLLKTGSCRIKETFLNDFRHFPHTKHPSGRVLPPSASRPTSVFKLTTHCLQ
ncbi:hypothetical protein C0Q70_14929 [Pomacea canaliculata]|uniref:Secreted protein n=1 Tax=Pomacea canaliculata TaxID=400727 RepID=A0A2T7NTH8_POMCA|nr:hypothetical protein C0Q70_14929 [Pomacea canaliculata]